MINKKFNYAQLLNHALLCRSLVDILVIFSTVQGPISYIIRELQNPNWYQIIYFTFNQLLIISISFVTRLLWIEINWNGGCYSEFYTECIERYLRLLSMDIVTFRWVIILQRTIDQNLLTSNPMTNLFTASCATRYFSG